MISWNPARPGHTGSPRNWFLSQRGRRWSEDRIGCVWHHATAQGQLHKYAEGIPLIPKLYDLCMDRFFYPVPLFQAQERISQLFKTRIGMQEHLYPWNSSLHYCLTPCLPSCLSICAPAVKVNPTSLLLELLSPRQTAVSSDDRVIQVALGGLLRQQTTYTKALCEILTDAKAITQLLILLLLLLLKIWHYCYLQRIDNRNVLQSYSHLREQLSHRAVYF